MQTLPMYLRCKQCDVAACAILFQFTCAAWPRSTHALRARPVAQRGVVAARIRRCGPYSARCFHTRATDTTKGPPLAGRSRMARNLRVHQHLLGGATQTTLSGCRRVGIMPRNGGRRVTLVEPRSACVPLSKGKTTYGPISDPSFMLKKTSVAHNFLLTRPLEISLPRIPHRRSSDTKPQSTPN